MKYIKYLLYIVIMSIVTVITIPFTIAAIPFKFMRFISIIYAAIILRYLTGANIINKELVCRVPKTSIDKLWRNEQLAAPKDDPRKWPDFNGAMVVLHGKNNRLCLLEFRDNRWCEGITKLPITDSAWNKLTNEFQSFTWLYK